MRYGIALCFLLVLSGCGSSTTARNDGPVPETETAVINEDGQVVLPSGDLFGAPKPTDKIGVSKPYILKLPICTAANMTCKPNIVPKSIVLGLPPIESPQQATSTAIGQ